MDNISFFIPDDIPPEDPCLRICSQPARGGQCRKTRRIGFETRTRPQRQKTVAKEQYSKVPLYTQRVLYLEESLPSMAYMYIISPSGGILQGDRYRMDITL